VLVDSGLLYRKERRMSKPLLLQAIMHGTSLNDFERDIYFVENTALVLYKHQEAEDMRLQVVHNHSSSSSSSESSASSSHY
jgi:hypothetical protein